jgi:hypothetical protein
MKTIYLRAESTGKDIYFFVNGCCNTGTRMFLDDRHRGLIGQFGNEDGWTLEEMTYPKHFIEPNVPWANRISRNEARKLAGSKNFNKLRNRVNAKA